MGMFDWLDASFTEALAQALIHSLWQGVLIVSLLIVGDQLGIGRSSERKYLFYMSGLVLLFLSTVVSFFAAAYWQPEVQSNTLLTPFNSLIISAGESSASSSNTFYWQGALVILWFTGFLFYGFKNIFGSLRLIQLRRNAQNAPIHWQRRVKEISRRMHIRASTILLSTTEVSVPFVMGVVRPIIMFPANYFVQLTPAQIEVILTHELTHIGRNDYLLNIVQVVIESLLFFNPAIWWLSKQIRRQREYCCDDRVQTNMTNQKTYLEALYQVARISTKHPAPAVALFDNNSELIMRMKRMSSNYQPQKSLRSLVMASIGLLTVFGLFAFNTLEKRSDNSEAEINNDALVIAGHNPGVTLNLESTIDLALLDLELDKIDIINRLPYQFADVQHETHVQSVMPLGVRQIVRDTNPPSALMLDLEEQMEELAEEMEELAEEMEEIIENSVEVEVEKIEALAEEMELIAEKYEEEIEDSPEMQRLEELSELMEEEMEKLEESLEEMEEGAMEELEELIEEKAEQYEDYESLTEEERAKLQSEMKALTTELHAASQEINDQYSQLMENPEMKGLQKEMEELSKELSLKHEHMQPMNEEMHQLQAEMHKHQQLMQEKMHGMVEDLQNALQVKAKEMELLHKELQQEMQRWEAEKKKNDE